MLITFKLLLNRFGYVKSNLNYYSMLEGNNYE